MAQKNGFDITKLIFQNVCVSVWCCGFWVRLSATPHFLFLCIVFFFLILFNLCFLALIFLYGLFSLFLLLTLLIMHLDRYILQALVRNYILEKGLSQYTTNFSNSHPTTTGKIILASCYLLNHKNIITLKSPLGLPQNNNQTKPFIGVWDLVTELQVYVQYSIKMR